MLLLVADLGGPRGTCAPLQFLGKVGKAPDSWRLHLRENLDLPLLMNTIEFFTISPQHKNTLKKHQKIQTVAIFQKFLT